MLKGVVQGVGFRPAVWRHATAHRLAGGIRNTPGGVVLVIGGEAQSLDAFQKTLGEAIPPSARIESAECSETAPLAADSFEIWPSAADEQPDLVITPDLAACNACVSETKYISNNRHQYALNSCAHCGPRYTIVESLPYDRARTTMNEFPMCESCAAEYGSPSDRRYHAESIACPICGPTVRLLLPGRTELQGEEALKHAAELLAGGAMGAVKGIGGFHLCCDALNSQAVQRLRERKNRPAKPLAVMARDLATAALFARVSDDEAELLQSPQRPIVLLRKTEHCPHALAPGNARLGLMLPYAPLHHLLMRPFQLLVMTSANESEEPICGEDAQLLPWLGGTLDFILTHNRRIRNTCDDSIGVVHGRRTVLVRRARGYVPLPVRLHSPASAEILCCGGDLKNVFALVRREHVYLSAHMGDLENATSLVNYKTQIERMKQLLGLVPTVVAHDLHPAYHSTQVALGIAADRHIAVQHHHAHLAACLAENGIQEKAIGLIFDGTGYGEDGALWGGEFLVGDAREYRRMASFMPLAMPGGERAIHEPWRMALAALMRALGSEEAVHRLSARMPGRSEELHTLAAAIQTQRLFLTTTSAGRLFDIMAFLLGAGDSTTFEAQHAMWLENLALGHEPASGMPAFDLAEDNGICRIDPSPFWRETLRRLERGDDRAGLAAAFHAAFVDAAVAVAVRLREKTNLNLIACSGGVFVNEIISLGIDTRLQELEFTVLQHRLTPPGDGCIALGQAAVASAQII